jgi:hypothetical protein
VTEQQHPIEFLAIANQQDAPDNSPELKAKTLGKWIKGLPLGNIHETSRMLIAALEKINHTAIAAPERFKLMKELQKTIDYCVQSLNKLYVGHALPLGHKGVQYWDQSQSLQRAAATGYKIICMDQLSGKSRLDKKTLAHSIYRAIRILGKHLLLSYELYATPPVGMWGELHRFFYFAEKNQLLDTPIKDVDNIQSKLNSINKAYKQLVLLSLAKPFQLHRKEAAEIYQALDRWAQYAELYIAEENSTVTSPFYCQLDSDTAPQYLSDKTTMSGKYFRLLDLSRLAAVLEKEISQVATSRHNTLLGQEQFAYMLQRLIDAWEIQTSRRLPRIRTHARFNVSMGLKNTGTLLTNSTTSKPVHNRPGNHPSTAAPALNSPTELTIEPLKDDLSSPGSSAYSDNIAYHSLNTPRFTTNDSAGKHVHAWKTINASAGGYCLLWDQDGNSHALVGEIVGIRDDNEPPQPWSVGIIRWMQYIKDKGLKLGIQLLSPEAVPGILQQPSAANTGDVQSYDCLLLPATEGTLQPPSLITTNTNVNIGDSTILNHQGQATHVKLTRLMERSSTISRYLYEPLQDKKNT